MRTLTYIWHDCFVYEDSRVKVIFDYWKDVESSDGDTPEKIPGQVNPVDKDSSEMPRFIAETERTKPVYVVVSHHHKDHFTKKIFEWSNIFANIKFIISKDVALHARHILNPDSIYKGVKPSPESVVILSKGEEYSDSMLSVKAYGSTDTGNSYALKTGGITLFHAGDLNAWIWKDESTEEEVAKEVKEFNDILDTISADFKGFDITMFPVDSRIGSGYYTGASIFVRRFNVVHFFPMHFGLGDTPAEQQKYQYDAARISDYANPERGEYICLQSPYSAFSMP